MPLYRDQLHPEDFDTPEEFRDAVRDAVPRPTTHCLRCHQSMTWADQRRQFGRLMNRGFTIEAAKQLMPQCQRCMTIILRRNAALQRLESPPL